jgi:hypothetical protein
MRRILIAVGVVLTGAAIVSQAAGGAPPPYPSDGPFLSWPARGDEAADSQLVATAKDAWDGARGVHGEVRTLYGGSQPAFGDVVILEGRQARDREVHVALLEGDRGSFRLAVDRPTGAPDETRALSFLVRKPGPGASASETGVEESDGGGALPVEWQSFLLTLPEPDASVKTVTSSAWDTYQGDRSAEGHPDMDVQILPPNATGDNVNVTIERGGDVVATTHPFAAPVPPNERLAGGTIEYLPFGMRKADSSESPTAQMRAYKSSTTQLRVREIAGSDVSFDALLTGADAIYPANDHAGDTMKGFSSGDWSGFAWISPAGHGYIVDATGQMAETQAYEVAQGMHTP